MSQRIKCFHEAPKHIFKGVQRITDGDYALANVFETDPDYLTMFLEAVAEGREVILDNGVYELDKAMNPDRFVHWINRLGPSYYIIPDVLEDAEATCINVKDWFENRISSVSQKDSKTIGVVQGVDYKSICDCYEYVAHRVDKVAISFNYSYYEEVAPHPNKLEAWSIGRALVLHRMYRDGVLREDKPLHLLGCATVQEGLLYKGTPLQELIDSIDTSLPVSFGLGGETFKPWGNTTKSGIKMFTRMNDAVSNGQASTIQTNVWNFRKFWNP